MEVVLNSFGARGGIQIVRLLEGPIHPRGRGGGEGAAAMVTAAVGLAVLGIQQ